MLEGIGFLVSYYSGGEIGNFFAQWQQIGVFSYILPFLLLFALIFGLLMKMNIFKDNKGINGIIAIVVSLMALQFEVVPRFFAEIFPRLGIGLALILVAIILLGIFIPNATWGTIVFFVIGAIIFVVIFFTTSDAVGWGSWWDASNFLSNLSWPWIIAIAGTIIIIIYIFGFKVPKGEHKPSKFMKDLFMEEK